MKYRKKPVVIEAIEWTGTNDTEVMAFVRASDMQFDRGDEVPPILSIRTLEGTMRAVPGDWIIKGVAGEFYPCKPHIFAKTYEPADGGIP